MARSSSTRLARFDSPQLDATGQRRTHLGNVSAVTTNYADAGVQRLVLAGAVRSTPNLMNLRAVV
jgi:DUF1009 family protein